MQYKNPRYGNIAGILICIYTPYTIHHTSYIESLFLYLELPVIMLLQYINNRFKGVVQRFFCTG